MMHTLPFLFLVWIILACGRVAAHADDSAGEAAVDLAAQSIEVQGSVEVELRSEEGFDDVDAKSSTTSNADLAIDLYAAARPTDWLEGILKITWDDEDALDFEEAFVSIGDLRLFPVFVSGGKMTLPFGLYDSAMVSDPLTQELGETRSQAFTLGVAKDGLNAALFLYNGKTVDKDHGDVPRAWGANLSYFRENGESSILLGTSLIENIEDSIGLIDNLRSEDLILQHRVPGVAPYLYLTVHDLAFSCVYMTALKRPEFREDDAIETYDAPQAWSAELGYHSTVSDEIAAVAAVSYSRSAGVGDLLPRKRVGGTMTLIPTEFLSISVEYLREFDYSVADGGTGDHADIFTIAVIAEF